MRSYDNTTSTRVDGGNDGGWERIVDVGCWMLDGGCSPWDGGARGGRFHAVDR